MDLIGLLVDYLFESRLVREEIIFHTRRKTYFTLKTTLPLKKNFAFSKIFFKKLKCCFPIDKCIV